MALDRMRLPLAFAAAAALVVSSLTTTSATAADALPLADPGATPATTALYSFLRGQGAGILVGQQHAIDESITPAATAPDGQPVKSDVFALTGEFPGLFGFDTLALEGREKPGVSGNTGQQNAALLAEQFVRADALGGVVTLSAHMKNFVTGNAYDDTSGRVVSHILPGGDKNADYSAYLDLVAYAAQHAQRADGTLVPVIFRPFHENTGSWFWWGAAHATAGEYKEIFRYTVEYLRDAKDVHNLLYAFSPNGAFGGDEARYLATYPGDQWIDVLGYDYYENSNAADDSSAYVAAAVQDLAMVSRLAQARGKVPALTEFGRNGDRTIQPSGNKSLQYFTALFDGIKADPDARRIAYALTWANFGSGQIYIPYPGHEMAADFLAVHDDPATGFSSGTGARFDEPGSTAAPQPFLRLVSPADGVRVTTPTTTVRAKVTGTVATAVTLHPAGLDEVPLTLGADGYWSATWEIGDEHLTNATVGLSLTAATTAGELTADSQVILGSPAVLPLGTVDDFEGYGDDAALRAVYTVNNAAPTAISLAPRGAGHAVRLSYAFDASGTGYLGFGKSYAPPQNWSGFGRLEATADPDGSGHKLVLQLQAGGVTFEAYPPLTGDDEYTAAIDWADFHPAPWDTANAGATLTPQRLSQVSQFFVYLNDAGGSSPDTGSITLDEIHAAGTGDPYEPEEPSAEPILVDDFESYADEAAFDAAWGNRGKTDLISLSTDAGQGTQALSFAYDNANGGWQDTARWLGGADWSGHDALALRVKGDGSANQLAIQIGVSGGRYYLASVPLGDAAWHEVTIPFADFAPSWPADLTAPLDDDALRIVNELVLASNSTSGAGTFGVDDLRVVGGDAPEEPQIPDGTPEVLDTFEGYADTAALRGAWNNIADQEWGDGFQFALAPGKGSSKSKAAQFVYDFSAQSYLQESRWLGGHNWAGLDGVTAWVDPRATGHTLAFRVRTPSATGTGDDWYWDLTVPLTGKARVVHLPFTQAVVTYPTGIPSTTKPTRAQLAKVNEFIVMASKAGASTTGSFYLDDLAVGAAPPEPPSEVAPSFVENPQSVTVKRLHAATFTVKAEGNPAPTYAWQFRLPGIPLWLPVPAATKPTLTIPALTLLSGTQFRAVAINTQGKATSTPATLTVRK